MHDGDEPRDPVEELAEEFLQRRRRGEHPSVAEYAETHPGLAERIRNLFPALLVLEDLGSESAETSALGGSARSSREAPQRLGDFRIVREIGRGGMGVVYEAVQESLGRRVAVKVLPEFYSSSPRALRRFHREAQAAARLHHTNIVSVFGVGEHEGRHFYIMQYIEGRSLDRVLAELKTGRCGTAPAMEPAEPSDPSTPNTPNDLLGADVIQALLRGGFESVSPRPSVDSAGQRQAAARSGETAGPSDAERPDPPVAQTERMPRGDDARLAGKFGPSYWRSVAGVGAQAAFALHFAHRQGTLHRDVKPGNLMLDEQGAVWITDFGLAKLTDQDDLTHPGDVVGTLRYMAPEQLEGNVDVRSDVYSLGLTLYELLTLRPAFNETSRHRLLRQVSQQDPPRPRALQAGIPADLETIVQKAIARDPACRYQIAGELGEDLQRFLEDRPIRARRTSPWEHGWRWCRRNPVTAGLSVTAVVLLVALAAGASAGYVQRTRAYHRELALRGKAQEERARAEANLQLAAEAFDDVFSKLSGAPAPRMLGNADEVVWYSWPGPAAVSRKDVSVLDSLLEFYDRFAQRNRDNERWQHETARAYRRVGDIQALLGRPEEAVSAYRRAAEFYERLWRSSPERPDYLVGEAAARNALAQVALKNGEFQEAIRETLRARDLLVSQQSLVMGSAQGRFELGKTCDYLGFVDLIRQVAPEQEGRQANRLDDGMAQAERGLALLQGLVADYPDNGDYRLALARCYTHLWGFSRLADAKLSVPDRQAFYADQALKRMEQLVDDFPANPSFQSELAVAYAITSHWPAAELAPDQRAQCVARLRRGIEMTRRLTASYPDVPDYRAALSACCLSLANYLWISDAQGEAAQLVEQAVDLGRSLQAEFPSLKRHPGMLPRALHAAVRIQCLRGDAVKARPLLEELIALESERLDGESKPPFVPPMLPGAYAALAGVLDKLGEASLAEEAAKQSATLRPLVGERSRRFPLGPLEQPLDEAVLTGKDD